jgi:hypothetical protein
MFDKRFEEEQLSLRELQSFLNYFRGINVIEIYISIIYENLLKFFALRKFQKFMLLLKYKTAKI